MPETISKEQWLRLTEQLRDRLQTHFTPEELEVIERFILIAGHGSTFDQVRQFPPDPRQDRHTSPAYAAPPSSKAPKKSIA